MFFEKNSLRLLFGKELITDIELLMYAVGRIVKLYACGRVSMDADEMTNFFMDIEMKKCPTMTRVVYDKIRLCVKDALESMINGGDPCRGPAGEFQARFEMVLGARREVTFVVAPIFEGTGTASRAPGAISRLISLELSTQTEPRETTRSGAPTRPIPNIPSVQQNVITPELLVDSRRMLRKVEGDDYSRRSKAPIAGQAAFRT